MNKHEFIDWYEDVRYGTRRLISIAPEEALDFRPHENSETIEQMMRMFGTLEEQFVKGICRGDWSDSDSLDDARSQICDAFAEDSGEVGELTENEESTESTDEIIDRLDRIHQESLDILADVTEEEFQSHLVALPWSEQGTIVRLLL
ncbi:MAG: hypothetical protein ABIC40_01265, partial [bacterium]